MKKELDIHNYRQRLIRNEECLRKSDISEKNKQLIFDFRDYCTIEGLSVARIERYLLVLKDWAKYLNKDFDIATKSDIVQGVRIVQERDYSAWTKTVYKSMLKRFFKWLKKTEDSYPDEVRWIKSRIKKTEMNLPGDGQLITEEEVKKMIEY